MLVLQSATKPELHSFFSAFWSMKKRIVRLQDLLGLLTARSPPQWAESWDNVGLQVGDPTDEVRRVLVCLDAGDAALEAALTAEAQAIVSHHPLIFSPIKSLSPRDETGKTIFRAIRSGISILSVHTNLDRAPEGLNAWLARRLGLEDTAALASGDSKLFKLVVFVPRGYEEQVAEALFRGGAGHLGKYDQCSFQAPGVGSFRPGQGAAPFLGKVGEIERAEEIRLETVVPGEALNRVLAKLQKSHPYEEVAFDVIPLANRRSDLGLGRIGRLSAPLLLSDFARQVKSKLSAPWIRTVGDLDRPVQKIALCGGSGGSLIGEALRQGADVLVTGDLKYHEARRAEAEGMALIDAGHFASEHLMVSELAAILRGESERRQMDIEFIETEGEEEPFKVL